MSYTFRVAQDEDERIAFFNIRESSLIRRDAKVAKSYVRTSRDNSPGTEFFLMIDGSGKVRGGTRITTRPLGSDIAFPTEETLKVRLKDILPDVAPHHVVADISGMHVDDDMRSNPARLVHFLEAVLEHVGKSGADMCLMHPTVEMSRLIEPVLRRKNISFMASDKIFTSSGAITGENKKLMYFSLNPDIHLCTDTGTKGHVI